MSIDQLIENLKESDRVFIEQLSQQFSDNVDIFIGQIRTADEETAALMREICDLKMEQLITQRRLRVARVIRSKMEATREMLANYKARRRALHGLSVNPDPVALEKELDDFTRSTERQDAEAIDSMNATVNDRTSYNEYLRRATVNHTRVCSEHLQALASIVRRITQKDLQHIASRDAEFQNMILDLIRQGPSNLPSVDDFNESIARRDAARTRAVTKKQRDAADSEKRIVDSERVSNAQVLRILEGMSLSEFERKLQTCVRV